MPQSITFKAYIYKSLMFKLNPQIWLWLSVKEKTTLKGIFHFQLHFYSLEFAHTYSPITSEVYLYYFSD